MCFAFATSLLESTVSLTKNIKSNLDNKASDIKKVNPAAPTEILRMVLTLSLFKNKSINAAASGTNIISVNISL